MAGCCADRSAEPETSAPAPGSGEDHWDDLIDRLARLTATDIKSVLREVRKLSDIRLVCYRLELGERGFCLNRVHPLYPELRSIFEKTRSARRTDTPKTPLFDLPL